MSRASCLSPALAAAARMIVIKVFARGCEPNIGQRRSASTHHDGCSHGSPQTNPSTMPVIAWRRSRSPC